MGKEAMAIDNRWRRLRGQRSLAQYMVAVLIGIVAVAAIWALATRGWQIRYEWAGSPGRHLEVRAAHAKARAGEIVLVDVRRPSEWRASGVPQSGYAITMHQNGEQFIAGLLKATKGRKDKALALICATGGRTTWLQAHLGKAGFTNLYNVTEGMMGSRHGAGWLKKGLPVRRWTGAETNVPANLTGAKAGS